ncbi:hypothetical protein [Phenylobacterium sp.]|uniref:hypothetical protein n=1 Tax=Phenylobacterium sp. TaxID=1871053 RepID=UPI003563D974
MAKATPLNKSLASRLSPVQCIDPVVQGLTPFQQAALHTCKHEMLASMFRLYMTVPQDVADTVLLNYFQDPGKKG